MPSINETNSCESKYIQFNFENKGIIDVVNMHYIAFGASELLFSSFLHISGMARNVGSNPA